MGVSGGRREGLKSHEELNGPTQEQTVTVSGPVLQRDAEGAGFLPSDKRRSFIFKGQTECVHLVLHRSCQANWVTYYSGRTSPDVFLLA